MTKEYHRHPETHKSPPDSILACFPNHSELEHQTKQMVPSQLRENLHMNSNFTKENQRFAGSAAS